MNRQARVCFNLQHQLAKNDISLESIVQRRGQQDRKSARKRVISGHRMRPLNRGLRAAVDIIKSEGYPGSLR